MSARAGADRPQISGGQAGNVAQLARVAATDTDQAGGALQELRRVWRPCVLLAGGHWRFSRSVAGKLAGIVQAGGIVCNGCGWPCVSGSSAEFSSASAGLSWLKRWRRWLQSSAGGMHVGCNPSRVNRESVAVLAVCVQDSKQESTQYNVCIWGVLCLLSMRIGNTSNSKAARLYALRFYVTRCIYGGTYGALSFAHGIGVHNGRSIIHALLLHALAVCQRACNIGLRGI